MSWQIALLMKKNNATSGQQGHRKETELPRNHG